MFAADLSLIAKGKRPLNGSHKAKNDATEPRTSKVMESGRDSLSSESGSDGESTDNSLTKCSDDGDLQFFEARLLKYYTEKGVSGAGNEKDFTFDGGLNVPGSLWRSLYKYQKTGVKWLWELHCQQVGGILGDEMGLGKTIQMIVFLASLHHSKLIDRAPPRFKGLGPIIIVTPVTLMHQWVREFHTWYPPIRVAILHSTGSSSASVHNLLHSLVSACGVVVTSYSTFLKQQDYILQHTFHYIILDEGHKIRNPEAQITVAVKRVKTVHRLILSGSPIQNNLKELWSLYDFVFPGRLGELADFLEHFAVPITQGGYSNASQVQVLTAYKCACVLRETISPYLIRRMKIDVNNKQLRLPPKSEQVLFCRLTVEQRAVYKEYISSAEVENILSGRLLVFPGLIKLRKICNHPDLTTGDLRTKYSTGKRSSKENEYGYYRRSGKMIVCKSLLSMWKRQSRKVLLFSQSTQMLDILESFVQKENYSYLRMDGSTPIGSRQTLVNKFNKDDTVFVFLLTTRVGGLGVNLTGASRIVIYDPDWNPSTDLQARERSWRIGQQRDVIIYRLICTGSVEEKIYQRQIFKQFLTNKILSNPKQRRFFKSGDLKDLFSLADDDNKEDSETHAIFAGTGSRIDLNKISQRAEQARKALKERNAARKAEEEHRRECLWQMAKQLSEKMGKTKEVNEFEGLDSQGGTSNDQMDDNPPNQNGELDGSVADISDALVKETRSIINEGLFGNLGDLDFESQQEDKVETVSVIAPVVSGTRCEGRRIPYLAKVRKFKYAKKDESDVEQTSSHSQSNDEEYILSKLIKKSLINGAMKHDTVVDACNADYAIVEAEADKVAKEAAEHLRRAKKRISAAAESFAGGSQSQKKPLFGKQLKPTSCLSSTILKEESPPTKVFGGTDLSIASSDRSDRGDNPSTSGDLLRSMFKRSGNPHVSSGSSEHGRLSEMLREFMLMKHNSLSGCVETADIIKEFPGAAGLPKASFKAILHQICHFERINGKGTWRLKDEFI